MSFGEVPLKLKINLQFPLINKLNCCNKSQTTIYPIRSLGETLTESPDHRAWLEAALDVFAAFESGGEWHWTHS